MTLEISGLGFHLNQVVRTAGTEILLHDELMSDADKLVFVVVYAGIFVELAFIVQLIAWYYAWHERRMENMIVLESQNSSEADTLETAYGPSVQLPSEPVTVQFLKKSMANGGHVALVAREKENATRYELPYEGLAGKVRENAARFELTYEALASKVNNLAKNLLASGVGHKHIVLLALDRGAQQIAAIYATMLCGAAWVPVDTAVPESRFQELLQDINPSLVVHHEDAIGLRVASWSQDVGVRTATTSDLQVKTTGSDWWLSPISINVKMDDCALVIYTSGTTGKPKGIMYSHAMINHGANAVADLMEMSQESIAFLKTPYMWAVVEWELFPALIRGGRLVVGSANVHKEPKNMADTILAEQVTSLVMAPDVLDLILDVHEQGSQLESLQHVISVGAALPVALANRFTKMSRISAKLHNVYGASESSCTVWTVPQNGVPGLWSKCAPVGVPQMGCCVWVLDEDLKKVPAGVTGELCFGGQLAMGYFKMPELTAEKFITHPAFGHIYRTGDLARWRAGVLEICGRKDRQVKISGVRVEPEEVENALRALRQPQEASEGLPGAEHKSICLKHVACVASTGSSPELVAFVSPTLSEAHVKLLKEYLASKLPRYYLPRYLFSRDELPLLPNGKVNLRMLVEDADRSVEMSFSDVVLDSLGQMRSISRGMLIENQVMQRCYSYWMLGVVIDHWYACPGIQTCLAIASGAQGKYAVTPWVNLALAQVGNYQALYGFILLSTLQRTCPKPGGKANTRLTLGYEDAALLFVYLLMGLRVDPWGDAGNNMAIAGHRWYLFMVIQANVCIALGQRLRMPGWLQVIVQYLITIIRSKVNFNPCAYGLPLWLEWLCCWIVPFSSLGSGNCELLDCYVQKFVPIYTVSFFYSRRVKEVITRIISRLGCNTAAWAVVAGGVSILLGVVWTLVNFYEGLQCTAFPFKGILHELFLGNIQMDSYSLVQPALFALAMTWLPFDMSWWGNAALSTYVLHYYFSQYLQRDGLHIVLKWAHDKPGLFQLLVLLALPIAFMTIVGPIFQYYLVIPSLKFLSRVPDYMSSRHSKDAPCGLVLGRCSSAKI
mmetsp:Transcript_23209/g.39637  ORF Transcript_23209/g.39637 Transcript_23209/m.39637 type:complete len:1069 (-) Transcript_23209:214-3420(-)